MEKIRSYKIRSNSKAEKHSSVPSDPQSVDWVRWLDGTEEDLEDLFPFLGGRCASAPTNSGKACRSLPQRPRGIWAHDESGQTLQTSFSARTNERIPEHPSKAEGTRRSPPKLVKRKGEKNGKQNSAASKPMFADKYSC